MSFGFSVGDFIAVGKLIFDITNALRGSKEEYQELIRELEGLARALIYVDKLKGSPSQADAVNRIKCAALTCRQPLEEFSRKVQKFEKSLGTGKSNGKLRDTGKKIQWAFGPGRQDEVDKLDYHDISTYLEPLAGDKSRSYSAGSVVGASNTHFQDQSHSDIGRFDGFKRIKLMPKAPTLTIEEIVALVKSKRHEIRYSDQKLFLMPHTSSMSETSSDTVPKKYPERSNKHEYSGKEDDGRIIFGYVPPEFEPVVESRVAELAEGTLWDSTVHDIANRKMALISYEGSIDTRSWSSPIALSPSEVFIDIDKDSEDTLFPSSKSSSPPQENEQPFEEELSQSDKMIFEILKQRGVYGVGAIPANVIKYLGSG